MFIKNKRDGEFPKCLIWACERIGTHHMDAVEDLGHVKGLYCEPCYKAAMSVIRAWKCLRGF